MMKTIDNFLNGITMYRVVVYELLGLLAVAVALAALHLLPYSPLLILYSAALLFAAAWVANAIFAWAWDAPSNPESTWITALILALIISPPSHLFDVHQGALAVIAAGWAVASKYFFAVRKKHIFNPAALGVAVTALTLNQAASWWIATPILIPFVLVGGLLVVRKIRRFDLFLAFLASALGTIMLFSFSHGISGMFHSATQAVLYAPLIFFATVMLTEPLTAPTTRFMRILFGVLVGLLFAPQMHIGSFYFTPELALLAGNLFAYLVSSKEKLILTLKESRRLSGNVYELVFSTPRPLAFAAGQYLEWTLPHARSDSRGIRRYFTIASSPTENVLRLGVKFYEPSSSYKRALRSLRPGDTIVVSQLAGDFTLPRSRRKKLAFIAGGIGSTPFRSMVGQLLDDKERRDIVMLYANKKREDAVYWEAFDRARDELGMRTIYAFSEEAARGADETNEKIDADFIARSIPDYPERVFYLSGPSGMVTAYEEMLRELGVPASHIKKDFFPGF